MKVDEHLEEILYRTIATYFAQAMLGLVLFLMFHYFARLYQRKFLSIWAYSWLAFVVFMFATILITVKGINSSFGTVRFVVSVVSMAACFAQVALVLVGAYIFERERVFSHKKLFIFLVAILIVSFGLVLFKHEVVGAASLRYLVRIGLKYLIVGVGFIWAGVFILLSPRYTRGLGHKLLSSSLIGIGLTYLYYSSISFSSYFNSTFSSPFFFGLMELIFNSLVGIGMITWLLEDERTKLKKTNKEMDSFFYSTSHDLRAPIASILGLVNLARMELKDETALKYFGMVENRVKKMDAVISDILQLARSTKADLKMEQIDFNTILKEVITDVKFNKGARAINLRYTPNPSFVLRSDYVQLKIIIGNLIANAVKYHSVEKNDPYIAVRFTPTQSEVVIEIEDNGTGISKDHQVKIFDMFYRASTQSEGTGLGLYIVVEAVSKLRGKISVTSEAGEGSIFTVRLPMV